MINVNTFLTWFVHKLFNNAHQLQEEDEKTTMNENNGAAFFFFNGSRALVGPGSYFSFLIYNGAALAWNNSETP
jgi:hypothetical protein